MGCNENSCGPHAADSQGWIKAGADGAAAPGPPLYQVNEVKKVTDTIPFKK